MCSYRNFLAIGSSALDLDVFLVAGNMNVQPNIKYNNFISIYFHSFCIHSIHYKNKEISYFLHQPIKIYPDYDNIPLKVSIPLQKMFRFSSQLM